MPDTGYGRKTHTKFSRFIKCLLLNAPGSGVSWAALILFLLGM